MTKIPYPSVGRIVHYVSYGTPGGEYQSECRAAVITGVAHASPASIAVPYNVPLVALCVFNPTGQFFNLNVPYAPASDHRPGTWHYPEPETGILEVGE